MASVGSHPPEQKGSRSSVHLPSFSLSPLQRTPPPFYPFLPSHSPWIGITGRQKGWRMEMSSNSLAVSNDSLNGLKFGEKIYFENSGGGGGSGSGSGRSSKVPKQPPRCQVVGCSVDLSGAKAYYGRHKVCGMHSKAPRVIVGGLEQRFCQQCSRFHQLPEFDQGKRSCRRRLAGHNERRRKPPPRSLSSRIERLSLSFHEDNSSRLTFRGFLTDFTSPQFPGLTSTASHQLQGGAHFSVQEIPVWDSSCALSLLSTQPWGSALTGYRAPATSAAAAPTTISSNSSLNGAPAPQLVISSGYNTSSWGFKSHGAVEPDRFSGELELALQGNRQCKELGDMMNWSL